MEAWNPIKIKLPVTPVGQMRARSCVRGRHAMTYKAPEQRQHEQTLAALLAPYRPQEPIQGPIRLDISAIFPVPMSAPKSKRQKMLSGDLRPTVKPDRDNIEKHLCDVLTQLGFWIDDKQVVEGETCKIYGEFGAWSITISPAERRTERDLA